jgi:hypothetical protein
MKKLILFLITVIVVACNNKPTQKDIVDARKENEKTRHESTQRILNRAKKAIIALGVDDTMWKSLVDSVDKKHNLIEDYLAVEYDKLNNQ